MTDPDDFFEVNLRAISNMLFKQMARSRKTTSEEAEDYFNRKNADEFMSCSNESYMQLLFDECGIKADSTKICLVLSESADKLSNDVNSLVN